MFDFLKNWLVWVVAFLAFWLAGCAFSATSPGSSIVIEQNEDGSGKLDAESEVHLAWELPIISTLGDLLLPGGPTVPSGE